MNRDTYPADEHLPHECPFRAMLVDLRAIVRQFVHDADTQSTEHTTAWYVEKFREMTA